MWGKQSQFSLLWEDQKHNLWPRAIGQNSGLRHEHWYLLYQTTEVMIFHPQWTLVGIYCSKTDCWFVAVDVTHKMYTLNCVYTKTPTSYSSTSGCIAYGQWESDLYRRNPIIFVSSAWIIQVIVIESSKRKETKPYYFFQSKTKQWSSSQSHDDTIFNFYSCRNQ